MKPLIRSFRVLIPVIALSAWSTVHATGPDWEDYVLLAYELTPAQEGRFNRSDGQLSPFWPTWKEKRLDKVHQTPEKNVTFRPDNEGFSAGADDAQITTYAAWGDKGLYLLFEVLDDDFVGYILTTEEMEWRGSFGDRHAESRNDAIELRLDQYSSEELVNNYDMLFPALDSTKQNGNSLTMAQYGLRFGGDVPDPEVEVFRRNPSYDPETPDSGDERQGLEYLWERFGIEDEAPAKGIEVEVLMGEGNIRYQEWRVAWSQVGMEGSFSKPTAGKQIAAIFGYNDCDQGYTTTREDPLRWRNAESFWRRPKEKGLGAWGDIEFSGPLATAQPAPEVIIAVRPFMMRGLARRAGSRPFRYTPNGRAIGAGQPVTGIVIERTGVLTTRNSLLTTD